MNFIKGYIYRIALKIVVKKIREDESIRYGWQSAIAMQFIDRTAAIRKLGGVPYGMVHSAANDAARNFLVMLCKSSESDQAK